MKWVLKYTKDGRTWWTYPPMSQAEVAFKVRRLMHARPVSGSVVSISINPHVEVAK